MLIVLKWCHLWNEVTIYLEWCHPILQHFKWRNVNKLIQNVLITSPGGGCVLLSNMLLWFYWWLESHEWSSAIVYQHGEHFTWSISSSHSIGFQLRKYQSEGRRILKIQDSYSTSLQFLSLPIQVEFMGRCSCIVILWKHLIELLFHSYFHFVMGHIFLSDFHSVGESQGMRLLQHMEGRECSFIETVSTT